jgi:zinc ribbon protein
MFCEQCGSSLQPGAQYCARCGKQLAGRVQLAHPARNRVQEHIRLLGIFWMALSALNLIGGGVLLVLANTLFLPWNQFPTGGAHPMFLRPLLSFIGVLILTKAAAGFLAGYGLLQRESWARILALILGFLALFNIPFGTALGIYTLWVLLPAAADQEYKALSRAA